MRHPRISRLRLIGVLSILGIIVASLPLPAHAETYRVAAFPFYSQEGSTITIVLSVSGAISPTTYQFDFLVRDPSTTVWTSSHQSYTTLPGQTEFSVVILFPSPQFNAAASTSLVGAYVVQVNEVTPVAVANVASTFFLVGLTDKTLYQRTQTVSIVATRYSPGETVTVQIRTSSTLRLVYNHVAIASSAGVVSDSWYIPRNATVTESYILTLTGTTTTKNPADAQQFNVQPATMSIATLNSSKSAYQRTETLTFSFQPVYPSGQIANTGLALVRLTRPDRANITLTTSYNSTFQTFVAAYKTTATNQTGTWTASLSSYGFDDGFGNTGPTTTLVNSPQLQPATLIISIMMKTSFAPSEQIKFNATIQYPDGSAFQAVAGNSASSTLSFSGGGYTATVPVVFDTALRLWVGSYSPTGSEPSGLWSLTVTASDSAQPPNSGSSVKAIQIQDRPPVATFTGSATTAFTGVAVSFDATSSSDPDGAITSYLWDFGDGSTGSGLKTSHSYSSPGAYTVKLTITDNSGSTSSSMLTVTVQANPQSSGNVSFPLFYFGILAAIIAAMLAGGFLAFRRHRVTHARLKIDLEAVKTEAGRIENQEFFQSVKDQLKKDKDD